MNGICGHEKRRWGALLHRGKRLLQLLATPCFDGVQGHAQGSRSSLDLVEGRFLVGIRGVPKERYARHVGHSLFQELQSFCDKTWAKCRHTSDVPARVREVRDEAAPQRI